MADNKINSIDQYRNKIPDGAVEPYDYLISENCTPSVAAASTIYTFGIFKGPKTSQNIIAEHFDITTQSISRRYRQLLKNQSEWTIDRNCGTPAVLEGLPQNRRKEDKGPKKEDLVNQVRELANLEKPRYGKENLNRSEVEALTGESHPLQQKEVLEDEFDLEFGTGKDGSVHLTINKSGVGKILNRLPQG